MGATIGKRDGIIISFIAALVNRSTHFPYSGFVVPSIIPGISLNCLLTSSTTAPPARPTAFIPIAPNKKGINPPMNNPTTTKGSLNEKLTLTFGNNSSRSWVKAVNKTRAANPADPIA